MFQSINPTSASQAKTARIKKTWLIGTRGGARFKEVPGSFCEALLSQVRENIPGMVRGASYTLETICGHDFWESLNRGQRISAGECMAHMVVINPAIK